MDRKKRDRKKCWICVILLVLAIGVIAAFAGRNHTKSARKSDKKTTVTQETKKNDTIAKADVYTFLQGPKSYASGLKWSGEWSGYLYHGNSFGGFGCGLCCIANVYDTLSPYKATPLDAFQFAQKNTSYSPTGKVGAISWEALEESFTKCGMKADLENKPATIEAFRTELSNAPSAILLVCSANSNEYWKDTPGHYVNIWRYNEKNHTVFLADPGEPTHNRKTVPDQYVYDALKTVSEYQILYIRSYDETQDTWKNTQMTGKWNH